MKNLLRWSAVALLAVVCVAAYAADWTTSGTNARGPVTLQSAATTGNGKAITTNGSTRNIIVYIDWGAGTSAGAVTVETASSADYAGTWTTVKTVNWTAASIQDAVMISGCMGAVRARISTTVVGGTVTVTAFGN